MVELMINMQMNQCSMLQTSQGVRLITHTVKHVFSRLSNCYLTEDVCQTRGVLRLWPTSIVTHHSATCDSNESRQAYSDKMTSTDGGSEVVKPALYSHSAHRCQVITSHIYYYRSRNFRVK